MGIIVTLLIYAALFALAELLRPKPEIEGARPGGLGDFQFTTAEEGRVVPIIWGTVKMKAPNVIWYGNLGTVTKTVHSTIFSWTGSNYFNK